jgi:predicted nucleotidyltransferase
VARVWVFGSVARGDDRPDSDLDLLIELERSAEHLLYVDDDIVWAVIEQHAPQLHQVLADEINTARSLLGADDK